MPKRVVSGQWLVVSCQLSVVSDSASNHLGSRCSEIEFLVPRRFRAVPNTGNNDFDQVGLSISRGLNSTLQSRSYIPGFRHFFTANTPAFRQLYKINLGIPEIEG